MTSSFSISLTEILLVLSTIGFNSKNSIISGNNSIKLKSSIKVLTKACTNGLNFFFFFFFFFFLLSFLVEELIPRFTKQAKLSPEQIF